MRRKTMFILDLLPMDLVILIVLELPRKKIKDMKDIYPRFRQYYQSNKEKFWTLYYHSRISETYRYKGYYQLKQNIKYLLPEGKQPMNKPSDHYSYQGLQYYNNKILKGFATEKLSQDILPSKKAICAIYVGKKDLFIELLKCGCINIQEMFCVAACSGNEEIIDYLLSRFQDDFDVDMHYESIISAIEGEHLSIVKKLVEMSAFTIFDFDTIMHTATRVGNDDIVDYLLTTGYEIVNHEEVYRIAVMYCNLKVFKYILPFVKHKPRYLTMFGNNLPVLEEMMDILKRENLFQEDCYTEILACSIRCKDTERIEKFKPLCKPEYGFAVEAACANNVELLKDYIAHCNNDYLDIMRNACVNKSDRVIEYLLSLDVKFSVKLDYLYATCQYGEISLFMRIFKSIEDYVTVDILNRALINASSNINGMEICKFLISQGANDIMRGFDNAVEEYKIFNTSAYIGRYLLSSVTLGSASKDTVYAKLLGLIFRYTDDVDLLNEIYKQNKAFVDSMVPYISGPISHSGELKCLRYLKDNSADLSGLRANSLAVDPTIAYVIDNF